MKLPAHVLFRKELSLMVWKPHGILDQALVNEIVPVRRVYAPLLAEGRSEERQVDRAEGEEGGVK